jgi:TolB-like protein
VKSVGTFPETSDITIDWDRGLISHVSGKQTTLRAQSLAVLKALSERAGTLVSKDDLIAKVWRGVIVTEDSLVQCITELRKALQDHDHAIIRTLPKRGYLLERERVPAVPQYIAALSTFGQVAPIIDQAEKRNSIAVLPFVNLSDDPGQEYFTDGLTEDVITDLGKVPGLFVIARNSSFAYRGTTQSIRQIAYDLGVRHIVEGSIRRSSDQLRITVQLSEAESGQQMWAERYDRRLADIFALQDEITQKIVSAIAGKLAPPLPGRKPPRNLDAYDLLLRGRDLWSFSSAACLQSRRLLEQALKLEPDYVEVLAELGVVCRAEWMFWETAQEDTAEVAYSLTKRACVLAPENTSALNSHGWVALTMRRYDESSEYLDRSLRINPNNAHAWVTIADFYLSTGQAEHAVDANTRGFRLNPTPPSWYHSALAASLVRCGKHEETLQFLAKECEAYDFLRLYMAVSLSKLGRKDEALTQARAFTELTPRWRVDNYVSKRGFRDQSEADWWLNAYREAGLPG